jgi:hypothetical protein
MDLPSQVLFDNPKGIEDVILAQTLFSTMELIENFHPCGSGLGTTLSSLANHINSFVVVRWLRMSKSAVITKLD